MHDLDRIQLETGEYEYGELAAGELEGRLVVSAPGAESHELELTSGLLEISSEHELEQFLGDLLSNAVGAVGRFARSPTGAALGGILRDAAHAALPTLGYHAAPGRGGELGGRIGAAASQLFELELEGLSNEDKEFELARRYVQWARDAARLAASAAGRVPAPPARIARAAAAKAAHRYAPGMLSLIEPAGRAPAMQIYGAGAHAPLTGRWQRRGHYIVVHL
jgi:hypothetical protein